MSRSIQLTVVGDGTSDRCLLPIIEWILDQRYSDIPYALQYASNLPPARGGLRRRIMAAVQYYPCDILVIHRDAEREPLDARISEVLEEAAGTTEKCVPAVPVRMTESWLLVDEGAIRRAANNPNGAVPLGLPPSGRWESLPDPKDSLFQFLRIATELNGRRLDRFNACEARARLAGLIKDFLPLRSLLAFRTFEAKLLDAVGMLLAEQQH